jgi:hypothetical protein
MLMMLTVCRVTIRPASTNVWVVDERNSADLALKQYDNVTTFAFAGYES